MFIYRYKYMHVYIRLLVAVYESKALSGLGLRFLGVLANHIVTPQIGIGIAEAQMLIQDSVLVSLKFNYG